MIPKCVFPFDKEIQHWSLRCSLLTVPVTPAVPKISQSYVIAGEFLGGHPLGSPSEHVGVCGQFKSTLVLAGPRGFEPRTSSRRLFAISYS